MGVLWRSGGSALLGGFGRSGVGESVGVVPYRWGSGLPVSGNSQESFRNRSGFELPNRSQETLRKLPALFCPCVGASVRPNSQMRVGASASANSQINRASARALANSQMPNLCLASANSQIDK